MTRRRFLIRSGLLFMLSATWSALPAFAEGRAPRSQKKSKSDGSATLQDAKDGANKALGEIDKGVHEAAHTFKDGANKGLQSLDDAIHDRKKKN